MSTKEDNNPHPWEDFDSIWKNKSAFFNYLRGSFRRVWSKSPVKIKFLQRHRYKIPNPSKKGKREIWGGTCNVCKNTFPMKSLQVDHKIPAGSLNDFSDIEGFVTRLLACGEDNLQLACHDCHTALSYSQRHGISFEEAKTEKEIIAKCKQSVKKQKEDLLKSGFSEAEVSNKDKRKECYRKLLGENDVH